GVEWACREWKAGLSCVLVVRLAGRRAGDRPLVPCARRTAGLSWPAGQRASKEAPMAASMEERSTHTAPPALGTVVALWRYPVKSMLGEELNAAEVTERGLLGDRAFALVDPATGKVVSAKHPRKWGRLFDCRAAFVAPPRLGAPLPPVRVT